MLTRTAQLLDPYLSASHMKSDINGLIGD